MRFETSVLKLDSGGRVYHRNSHVYDWNAACRRGLVACGWVLPWKAGSKIILVFSTVPVRGASSCYARRLAYAGYVAKDRRRLAFSPSQRLWWWPEIVTEK